MGARVRLVKVIVQPVFVLDDGTTIVEVDQPPIAIPAAEWPTYSGERFPREVAEWQARLDAESTPLRITEPLPPIPGKRGTGNVIVEDPYGSAG